MIELEREFTYLVNVLPMDLDKYPSKIIEDNYVPRESAHPVIRIRRNDEETVITKKYPEGSENGADGDSSRMIEHTIPLSRAEYDALNSYNGKKFKKRRFAYEIGGYNAGLDVYLADLAGLVLIDFEFKSDEEMRNFKKPDFAGADVTQDHDLAGGMLCGKTYADVAGVLKEKYNYEPVKDVVKYEE